MDPSLQITIAAFGSVASFVVALIIVAILVRVVGEKQDTAAEERKTLLERIECLREEVKGYGERTTNYIVFNHTANRIVGDVAGTVDPEGEIIKFRPFKIEKKYLGHRVRLLAILSDGEEARLF